MTQIVVLQRFPGGKPGQILDLDARTQKQVDAGNAKLLPAGDPLQASAPSPTEDIARMRGTGNAGLSLVTDDYDELTAPGEKGPEDWEVRLDAAESASPSEEDDE